MGVVVYGDCVLGAVEDVLAGQTAEEANSQGHKIDMFPWEVEHAFGMSAMGIVGGVDAVDAVDAAGAADAADAVDAADAADVVDVVDVVDAVDAVDAVYAAGVVDGVGVEGDDVEEHSTAPDGEALALVEVNPE